VSHEFSFIKTLRFYRGRKRDVERAYRAMVRHDVWRKDLHVDTIYENDFSAVNYKKFKSGPEYKMKSGDPVVYIIARFHDKNLRNVDELRNFIIYRFEEALKVTNPNTERINIVFDLHGFSMNCMDYEIVRAIIDTLGLDFPETLQRAFIINHPMLFSACWYVISPWIDEVTRAKVAFMTPAELSEFIDVDTVPHEVHGMLRSPPPS
jgi:hypothetical protein